MAHSHVPPFGNWESEENVLYTKYFEKARKGRKGEKVINPNNPQENPDLYSDNDSRVQSLTSGAKESTMQPDARPERQRSRENKHLKQHVDSHGASRAASGHGHKRPTGASIGSENSFEHSPLHPQARTPGRGVGAPSPVWEGKSSYGNSHGTPGRSRPKPSTRLSDSPDKGAAVPRFGDWDESNPDSGEGYTQIFNRMREENQSAGTRGGTEQQQGMASSPYNYRVQNPKSGDNSKICCWPWFKK